jgi:hypothetical protein
MQDRVINVIIGEIPTRWVAAHCLVKLHAMTLRAMVVAA